MLLDILYLWTEYFETCIAYIILKQKVIPFSCLDFNHYFWEIGKCRFSFWELNVSDWLEVSETIYERVILLWTTCHQYLRMLALIDFSKNAPEENLHFVILFDKRSDSDWTVSFSQALWLKDCDALTTNDYSSRVKHNNGRN